MNQKAGRVLKHPMECWGKDRGCHFNTHVVIGYYLSKIIKLYNYCIGLRHLHKTRAKPDGILITRNNFSINQPICFNSIRYDGAKRWNNLDKDMKGCVTLGAFNYAILKWNA